MASLTINGSLREIRLSATDIGDAEQQIMKQGGRPIMAVFSPPAPGIFGKHETEWLLWAAWRHALSHDRIRALIDEYYRTGGTFMELHGEILEAVIDSGLYGRRQTPTNGAGPPDPPPAGISA